VPRAGAVRLIVYDLMGRPVKTIVDDVLEAGAYASSVRLANALPGVYVLYLATPRGTWRRQFALVR